MIDVSSNDLLLNVLLVFLEGILSIDNALVLAMIAKPLPIHQRKKALTYGLAGAFIFQFIALSLVTYLIKWRWVKFVGGGYLLYISIKHLLFGEKDEDGNSKPVVRSFWKTVILIELMDIAFAVDSILAAVALTQKLWVVYCGGILSVIMMRFAATIFIRLLEKFPRLEKTAYLLILIIGTKITLEGFHFEGIDMHSASSPYTWAFWGLMAACVAYGFISRSPKKE